MEWPSLWINQSSPPSVHGKGLPTGKACLHHWEPRRSFSSSPLPPPPPQPLSTQMLITALGEKTLRKTPCSEPPIPLWGLGWGHRTVGPMSPPFENFFSNGGRHFSHILSRGTFLCFEKNNSRNLPFVHFLGRYIQCPYLFGDRANRTKLLMFPCPKFSEGSFSKGHSIR